MLKKKKKRWACPDEFWLEATFFNPPLDEGIPKLRQPFQLSLTLKKRPPPLPPKKKDKKTKTLSLSKEKKKEKKNSI